MGGLGAVAARPEAAGSFLFGRSNHGFSGPAAWSHESTLLPELNYVFDVN